MTQLVHENIFITTVRCAQYKIQKYTIQNQGEIILCSKRPIITGQNGKIVLKVLKLAAKLDWNFALKCKCPQLSIRAHFPGLYNVIKPHGRKHEESLERL